MENVNNLKKQDKLVGFEVPFFQVDNNIFDLDLELNIYHKIVYIYLCRCGNQKNDAFPSYLTIAEKCGCSKRKAIDTIDDLINFGLLQKKLRKNKKIKQNLSNIYFLKPVSSHYLCEVKQGGSAQYALGGSAHHALGSAHGAPKKELIKKNLEEDEEAFLPVLNLFIKASMSMDQPYLKAVSPLQVELLKKLVDKYSVDFVMKAIEITSTKANNFNMDYLEKVLKSYEKKGHKTIEDIEKAEEIENMKKNKIEANRKKNLDKQSKIAPVKKEKKDKGNFNNFQQRDCPFACVKDNNGCDKDENISCTECELYKNCSNCKVVSCS